MFSFKKGYLKYKKIIQYSLITAAFLCGYSTYIILTTSTNAINSNFLLIMLYVDIVLLLLISFLLFDRIRRIFRFSNKKKTGNMFHKQIITLFSIVTIIPSLCVFIFSVLFFNIGIETLFKNPVNNAMKNANQVVSIYINEMKTAMSGFAGDVSNRVCEELKAGFGFNRESMEKIISEENSILKRDIVIMQYNGKVIAKSAFSISLQFEKIPNDVVYLNNGEKITWENNSGNAIISLVMLDKDLGIYLLAAGNIDQKIIDHRNKIKNAMNEYIELKMQRKSLKFTFFAFFSIITILLLLSSILVGFMFANWILKPVNKLIIAAKNVSMGQYNIPIKTEKLKNEWDVLISSFNTMISKLESQKQQLIISNTQNAWKDIARKIAHEIKNPLTPIQLSAERLKRKYQNEIKTTPQIFNTCIDTIIRQVQCIGTLVNEFSNFARMPAPKMTPIDLVALIKESVFIQASSHKNISFNEFFDRDSFICSVDQTQINQIMMNILQNSINAIEENKENKGNNQTNANIDITLSVNERTFCVIIDDDGPGFSENIIKNAFLPYHTTRETGNGLGLSIVHKIIVEHGGTIKIGRSKKLLGASIVIEIPYNINSLSL